MNIKTRDTLRSATIEKLLSVFPNAQLVKSNGTTGIGYVSDTIDEETGTPYVVVIGVSIPLTADNQHGKAYDFDAAVEAAKNAPGRRVADPVKQAEAAAKKAITQTRKANNLAALTAWINKGGLGEGMIPSQIYALKDEIGLDVSTGMMVGTLLKELAKQGILVVDKSKDEKRRNFYMKA